MSEQLHTEAFNTLCIDQTVHPIISAFCLQAGIYPDEAENHLLGSLKNYALSNTPDSIMHINTAEITTDNSLQLKAFLKTGNRWSYYLDIEYRFFPNATGAMYQHRTEIQILEAVSNT